tara:strand:+ start:90 stop:236 length:147 start_codon:yes stop_codon:yes gene_type:complete
MIVIDNDTIFFDWSEVYSTEQDCDGIRITLGDPSRLDELQQLLEETER